MSEDKKTSIVMRLRRITTEVAYVMVPVTTDWLQTKEDLSVRASLDIAKLTQAACQLGTDPLTKWEIEQGPVIEIHPIQQPLPKA